MDANTNPEPLTASLLVRRATVLLARANELQSESELLKRQTHELLEMARQFHGSPEPCGHNAEGVIETMTHSGGTLGDALVRFGEFLLRPRHLSRHAR